VPEYVGYWEGLQVEPSGSGRLRTVIVILVLIGIFLTPLLIDGIWWLTLAVSEVVVGTILVLGAPPGARQPGTALFRRRVVLPVVLVVAVVFYGAFMAYDDLLFGTWSLSGPPPKVLACGAEYHAEGGLIPAPRGVPLHQVGTTPSGLPILGNANCGNADSTWAFVGSTGKVRPYEVACLGACPSEPYSR
jgi:hypothetical protein